MLSNTNATAPLLDEGNTIEKKKRILIYSHDSFGLGHLRRCREIAQSIVANADDVSVLILSGSPIIGSFDFRRRVDFVRIPGVIKLRNGQYTSLSLDLEVNQMLDLRSSIIEHTAKIFQPHIFLVDKEPLGLRAEVRPTLEMLKQTDTRTILGLRDVMDDSDSLHDEWERKDVYPALRNLYDEIWVYGLRHVHDPYTGLPISENIYDKTLFTGYLRRSLPGGTNELDQVPFEGEPYILVTPGGGGDGVELVDWVIRAYESYETPLFPALIVLGPFMDTENRNKFSERAERLRNVQVMRFTPVMERYISHATAIVAMGGYNTFCEILSFDKPTLLVPRVVPRQEQTIRAAHARDVGLLSTLAIDNYPNVELMSEALFKLTRYQQPPSNAGHEGLLGGLEVINARVGEILSCAPKENPDQRSA